MPFSGLFSLSLLNSFVMEHMKASSTAYSVRKSKDPQNRIKKKLMKMFSKNRLELKLDARIAMSQCRTLEKFTLSLVEAQLRL